MLVMSKLNFSLRLVTPVDYLNVLVPEEEEEGVEADRDRSGSSTSSISDCATLVASLCLRDSGFCRRFDQCCRCLASAALCRQSQERYLEEEAGLRRLGLDRGRLRGCLSEMETLLWTYLPSNPSSTKEGRGGEENGNSAKTTPQKTSPNDCNNQSPFKITKSSTPKSGKSALLTQDNLCRRRSPPGKIRRRLRELQEEDAAAENVNKVCEISIGLETPGLILKIRRRTTTTALSAGCSCCKTSPLLRPRRTLLLRPPLNPLPTPARPRRPGPPTARTKRRT